MAEAAGLQLAFPYRGFSKETEKDLRDLLGAQLPAAMPSLLVGAGVYVAIDRRRTITQRIRGQLDALRRSLRQIDVTSRRLTSESRQLLMVTYDKPAIMREPPATSPLESLSGFEALSRLLPICNQAQRLVEFAMRPIPRANTPQRFLALMVAVALQDIGAPISKGQSGLFARVLRIVWHDVKPGSAPDEVFRHLKEAADRVLADSPQLRPRKGRPSKAAKRVRSATS